MSAQQPIRPPPVAVQDPTTTITSSPLPSSSSPSFAYSPAADGQSPYSKQPSSRKSFDGGLLKRMISRDRDHDGHRHDSVEGGERKEKRKTSFDVRLPTLGLIQAAPGGVHGLANHSLKSPTTKYHSPTLDRSSSSTTSSAAAAPDAVSPPAPDLQPRHSHTPSFHRFPTRTKDDEEHNEIVDLGSEARRRVVEDCLALFSSKPSLEILHRSWREDATFEDPMALATGFAKYSAQWFGLASRFPSSTTLSYRVLRPDPTRPNQIRWEQVQEYKSAIGGLGKTIHSLIIIDLDDDDKIVYMKDCWDGKEDFGIRALRKLNGTVTPWFVHVPKE